MSFELHWPEETPQGRAMREMIDQHIQYERDRIARRIEEEAHMFLRMGFELSELTLAIYDRWDTGATHVIPTLMLGERKDPDAQA